MNKLFFFDLETTGTKFWKNGIHQISGAIKIGSVIKERFDFKVRPYKDAIIEQKALDIGGVTKEQIMAYPPMEEVYQEIKHILHKYVYKYDKKDKFFKVGYNNAAFDDPFLRAFFVQNGDEYYGSWFWSSNIDVMVMATHFLMSKRPKMPNFQLSTVAETLGVRIDRDKLHDAEYDIDLTIQCYDAIIKKIKYEQMKSKLLDSQMLVKGKL